MKAAVLHNLGASPIYEDISKPEPADNELLLKVKAVAIKNIDKLRASGTHYASYTKLPVVVGMDAVGTLADGKLVYAQTVGGAVAEYALIKKNNYIVLPENIDIALASALPNTVMGAALVLQNKAKMQPGDVILINGATGITGRMAVQFAKQFGAKKIIVTGRNETSLQELKSLGADETISLTQPEEAIIAQLKSVHAATPVNIVVDYLWGKPVELIIAALKGGGMNNFTPRVQIITVGDMAGKNIELSSGVLRSSAIEILGSGIGSLSEKDMKEFATTLLPQMFQLAAEDKWQLPVETFALGDIEKAWTNKNGKRVVVQP